MLRHRITLLALFLACYFPAVLTAQLEVPLPPAGVKFTPDLTYLKTEKGASLQLDIAMPAKGDAALPAVVIIHGTGGFSKGRKANVPLMFELAEKGYVGVAISFRHTAADPYPAAIDDVRDAVRWLRANAKKYRIDPDRVAALGYSGGGSLALLLGMPDSPGAKKEPNSQVQAVVAYYPPTDLAQLHADCGGKKIGGFAGVFIKSNLEKWLEGTPQTMAKRYAEASPVTHVRKEMAPALLVHGTADNVVPIDQSRLLVDRAAVKGGRVMLLELPGAGHLFDELKDANTAMAARTVQTFLDYHLQVSLPVAQR
jgi:acetyl esterase/lipase